MLVRHYAHEEWELMKWVILVALASALTLAFTTGIAGAAELRPPTPEPPLLPENVANLASPMGVSDVNDLTITEDVSSQVWQAIDAQYHNEFESAIAAWQNIQLPCDTEVWKHVALGQAYLATGEIDAAITSLDNAENLDSSNAVVRYALGVLRLQQAYLAEEWNDREQRRSDLFVATSPREVVPNTSSMYRLKAMMELEAAIELAPQIHLHESLVPEDWPTTAASPPTVLDVLLATRMERFPAKAHNMLGALYLKQGSLDQAEHHMDKAVDGGLSVAYGYSELAEAYENAGRHSDAMRTYLKASQQEPGKTAPLRKAWENMWESIL